MTINKYTGKTKEEAIQAAKAELGEGIVIMNTKNRKQDGILGIVKPSIWEVTVAVEEETDGSVSIVKRQALPGSLPTSTFSAVADERLDIPSMDALDWSSLDTDKTPSQKAPNSYSRESQRRDALRTQVLEVGKGEKESQKTFDPIEPVRPVTAQNPMESLSGEDLKDVFRQMSMVVETAEERNELYVNPANHGSNIIKKENIVNSKRIEEPLEPKSQKTPVQKEVVPNALTNPEENTSPVKRPDSHLPIVRIVYNTLMDNEVDEKYINHIFDDIGNILSSASSLDHLISNIYQKMVLKLGSPNPISLQGKGPLVVFFVGPTGVGKTTTIAKIASEFKLIHGKKVSFVTADTYRIAATEQLNVYANILDAPISVVYDPSELNPAIEGFKDQDLVLVDTVGFSHKNAEQRAATKALIDALDEKYQRMQYLVLSVTTKYGDLKEIADIYKEICKYDLIFTKLDETKAYGNILNLKMYTGASLSYVTNGQTVPDDIEIIDSQKLVKAMLGGS